MSFAPIQKYKPGLFSVAYVTTPTEGSAMQLARELIGRRMAGCINIIPGVVSFFEWEGTIVEHQESLLLIKTRSSRVEELCTFVRENHPYSVAEVSVVPIENGNPAYLTWLCRMKTNPDRPMANNPQQKYKPGLHSVAYVTTPNEESALKLSRKLVERKLAACVNIVPRVVSIYEWEGKINEHHEILLVIKTRTTRVDELCQFVRENHPYSVAEVVALPIENGNPAYLTWLSKAVPEGKH